MSRLLGVRLQGLHLQRCLLLDGGQLCISGEGGECTCPHEQGGVCCRHREHTFCSPADFLGDQRRGRRELQHCPDGPSPEGEVLLPGVHGVVFCIPAPPVTHPCDVERGASLIVRLYRRRGELDAC